MNATEAGFRVKQGECLVIYQFELGMGIDLEVCRALISASPAGIKRRRPAPDYFQFDPLPLQLVQAAEPLAAGGARSAPEVSVLFFDFGSASFTWTFPVAGGLDELAELGERLIENEAHREAAMAHAARVLEMIRPAVKEPQLNPDAEDYLIYRLVDCEWVHPPEELGQRLGPALTRLLRGQRSEVSAQEVADALAQRISYGPGDAVFVDWQAAVVVDREPGDVITVLEFANLQLLELRSLDRALDRDLDRAYALLAARKMRWFRLRPSARLLEIARMQVDGAYLFEQVGNALKLTGDPYLARVYRMASQRFQLGEWNASILRKLETLNSIYEKLSDQAATRRLEVLEWIIILLITLSIVLQLLPATAGH